MDFNLSKTDIKGTSIKNSGNIKQSKIKKITAAIQKRLVAGAVVAALTLVPTTTNASTTGVDKIFNKDIVYSTSNSNYGKYSGDSGKSSSLFSGSSASWGKNFAKAGSISYAGRGNSDAWAYTGKKFTFTGKKSESAYIRYKGAYVVVAAPLLGSTSYKIYASVYDCTSDSELGGITIAEGSNSSSLYANSTGKIAHSNQIILQPNHTYLCKIGIETDTSTWGTSADIKGGARLDSVMVDLVNY